jgi:putative ATP-dependent endonuclease of OLD family
LEEGDRASPAANRLSEQLRWVLEAGPAESLWIMKVFEGSTQSVRDFVLTPDAVENGRPLTLFDKTHAVLSGIKNEIGIPNTEINNENRTGRFTKSEIFRAIYGRKKLEDTWALYNPIPFRDFFPDYQYLDWNVSMDQLQDVARSAIQTKIGEHFATTVEFANQRAREAQAIVDEALAEFTDKFAIDLPNIEAFKSTINFSVESRLTEILINKANTHGDIHLDSQGDGIKRQIWFALIKWSALSSLEAEATNKKFIWCFDEPETHLYPKAQRELFQLIKEVSKKNIQTLISTHSTVFIDRANFSNILRFELEDGFSKSSSCAAVADIHEALQIRNSDFLFYDRFVVVEGSTEEILFPHLFKLYANESLIG